MELALPLTSVPIETLHALLRLDVETGRLYWLKRGPEWFGKSAPEYVVRAWNTRRAGTETFVSISVYGYRMGRIFNMHTAAHRVVFAMVHGRWPDDQIDHIDGNRSNNVPSNLREATRHQNKRNAGAHRNGSSRFCGVSWSAERAKWVAQCMDTTGTQRNLGRYRDEDAAARAYDAAAAEWHGELARLNFPQQGV